jgi:hypothetical protein
VRNVPASIALIASLIALTVAFVLLGNGNLGAAISPVLLITTLYAIWKVPLRFTLFPLMFCALVLENPYIGLAVNEFKSPLAPIGGLILGNLNLVTGVQALHFTGLDCITAYLLFLVVYRRATGSHLDRRDQVETASPMGLFAWVALSSIVALWTYGILRGGSLSDSLWQVHKLLYVPVMFFLFQAGLRGRPDYQPLARVLVAAALVRSVAAILIRAYYHSDTRIPLQVATTHADSLLFASAFAVMVACFLEQPNRQQLLRSLLVVPVLIWGMSANTRRLVWVEVAGVLIAFYLITPWTRIKRSVTQAAVAALPLLLTYVAIGWNSGNPLFAPVQVMRSITEPETDASSEWREHENFNLIYNVGAHPLLGSGFGHEYIEYWSLPDISRFYPQYRYNPHNTVLGLWNSAGLLGFAGYWTLLVVAVFFAARSYHRARLSSDRAVALSALGIVVVYIAQAYGDIGFAEWNAVFIVAPALAIVGKLAVLTGAWPGKQTLRPESLIAAQAGT